ncbi:hypothetical protein [Burkholderia lata]|uniref:hypothetical protein n=1 Tax=Burkholderia lata (strain ATCC 17760 / DSM 23089 / LMG 22485 / NCIMB 9086 / R18194 / 383) TaxID=482957 RepID=UPI00399BFFC6
MKRLSLFSILVMLAAPAFAGQCNGYGYAKKVRILEAKADVARKYGDFRKETRLRAKLNYLKMQCGQIPNTEARHIEYLSQRK